MFTVAPRRGRDEKRMSLAIARRCRSPWCRDRAAEREGVKEGHAGAPSPRLPRRIPFGRGKKSAGSSRRESDEARDEAGPRHFQFKTSPHNELLNAFGNVRIECRIHFPPLFKAWDFGWKYRR